MEVFLVYLALLAIIFFFLVVRPQRRQMAARRALISAVEVGDEVITAGGIYGTVREIEDDVLQIEVAEGVVLTIAREAIARRRGDEAAPGDLNDEPDDASATED